MVKMDLEAAAEAAVVLQDSLLLVAVELDFMVKDLMVLVEQQQLVVAVVLVELTELQEMDRMATIEVMVVIMEAAADVEVQELSVMVVLEQVVL